MELPFEDGSFDAVVCQFGVMFFPDRPRAFAEARRVLRPGGSLIFSTWDRIEENEFADEVTAALAHALPGRPAALPGANAPRLSRPVGDRSGSRGRWVHAASLRSIPLRREAGRRVPRHPGPRVLPGHAAPQRDRGARSRAARRGDGCGGGGDRAAVRDGSSRREDPGPGGDRSLCLTQKGIMSPTRREVLAQLAALTAAAALPRQAWRRPPRPARRHDRGVSGRTPARKVDRGTK